MLVMKNMDELMTMDLPTTSIAAAHACTCNPRKKPDYPVEWLVTSMHYLLCGTEHLPYQDS